MHLIFDVMHWPRQVYLFDSKVSSEIPLAVGVCQENSRYF